MSKHPDFEKCTVLVVGDVMLDRYFWGEVGRISPEAPVPVVRVMKKTETLGGAGNVALNITELNANCILLGVSGKDTLGELLASQLKKSYIENRLITTPKRPTTTKTRIIGQGQQLVRLDEEEASSLDEVTYKKILTSFKKLLPGSDIVIVSDYGKGVFEKKLSPQIIQQCTSKKIPVFVDPKGMNWQRYKGATCITPNTAEFSLIASFEANDDKALSRQAKKNYS